MNRSLLLSAAYALDQLAGDPEWFPHPVRLIGFAISRGETWLRRPNQSNTYELVAGTALTLAIVGSTYWLSAGIIRKADQYSSTLGTATEVILGWTCLAARNLEDEAHSVVDALKSGNLGHARHRVARIVGRDADQLDTQEVSRAVIETVAESASDGIMSPLFYMALGGVPLAMAYKAINTLDSMIGHADKRYFYFGKAAARFDDAANYLTSRLTALTIIATSRFVGHSYSRAAWRTWRRDGSRHKSPNAGQPESAVAGALQVALGGPNSYAGETIAAQQMGAEFPAATPAKAARAIRLVSTASFLALVVCVVLSTTFQTGKRG
jgi:adenosylcobinamide-phosphate synthase